MGSGRGLSRCCRCRVGALGDAITGARYAKRAATTTPNSPSPRRFSGSDELQDTPGGDGAGAIATTSRRRRGVRGSRGDARTRLGPEFAEPVALSSTQSADRPLPRRALRLSLDLVTLRARRTEEPKRLIWDGQVASCDL